MKEKYFTICYKDEESAVVFRDEKANYTCESYTKDPLKTPFAGGKIDRKRIDAFLRSRCPNPARADLRELLEHYGLDVLDPDVWCRKTHGVTYDDFFWIRFPDEKLTWDDVRVR